MDRAKAANLKLMAMAVQSGAAPGRRRGTRQRARMQNSNGAGAGDVDSSRQIFVGGLPQSANEDVVRTYFSQFGNITEVQVLLDRATGRHRGFGFVTFQEGSGVDLTLSKGDHTIDGKVVEIKRATPKGSTEDPGLRKKQIFVANLAPEMSADDLKHYFSQFGGEIVDAQIMIDKSTGKSRGFGFVNFNPECPQDVLDKIVAVPVHKIGDQVLDVKKAAQSSSSHLNPNKMKQIFVGGLAPIVNDKDFRDYFSQYGTIVESMVMMDRNTNRSRGFGFITFDNHKPVDEILQKKDHTLFGKVVEIKLAVPKDKQPRIEKPRPGPPTQGGYGGVSGGGPPDNAAMMQQMYNMMMMMMPAMSQYSGGPAPPMPYAPPAASVPPAQAAGYYPGGGLGGAGYGARKGPLPPQESVYPGSDAGYGARRPGMPAQEPMFGGPDYGGGVAAGMHAKPVPAARPGVTAPVADEAYGMPAGYHGAASGYGMQQPGYGSYGSYAGYEEAQYPASYGGGHDSFRAGAPASTAPPALAAGYGAADRVSALGAMGRYGAERYHPYGR